MGARAQAILPLALVIGVLSFLWTELSLNYTFHWTADPDLVPANFHLILPTAFIAWGLFFAAGGDNAAFGKIVIASLFGCVAAYVTMELAGATAEFPDFWGLALWVGIFAFILVMILIAGDWYYVAGTFPAFAAVFLYWIANGLDAWVPGDEGLATHWVATNTFVALFLGTVLGLVSAKLAAALTPKPSSAEA